MCNSISTLCELFFVKKELRTFDAQIYEFFLSRIKDLCTFVAEIYAQNILDYRNCKLFCFFGCMLKEELHQTNRPYHYRFPMENNGC